MTPSDNDSSDRALLSAVGKGEARALETLFRRHNVRVFRFVMRIVANRATAEDVLSEVFLQIWQHAGRYEGRSAPTTWMLSIAYNKAVSTLRQRRETIGIEESGFDEMPDNDDTADVALEKRQTSEELAAAIARLSPDHRAIVDLCYFQELSVAEAADVLGIPEATVKTRMFYARKKLSQLLGA